MDKFQAQPHEEMCDELQSCLPLVGESSVSKKQMFMAPRYSYKTSILSAWLIYCIFYYEARGIDITMLYVRASVEHAHTVLFEIKMHLQTNETILELWGDVSLRAREWSEDRINLGKKRDATLSAGGLTVGMAGKHPDIIVADDLVDEENYESLKIKRQAIMKLESFKPLLPPWGTVILSGTFWAHDDVYSTQIKNDMRRETERDRLIVRGDHLLAESKKPEWRKYIRSVYNADGSLYFPAVLNDQFLEEKREMVSPKMFSAWYLMRPDIEGMVLFDRSYLRYFSCNYQPPVGLMGVPTLEIIREDGTPAESFPVYVTMTIDPTITASGSSDYTGCVVNATDSEGNWWVLLARRFLMVPSKVAEELLAIIAMFMPPVVRIESAMADVEMVARLQRGISDLGIQTFIASYNPLRDEGSGTNRRPSRRKKTARIEALEPRFRNGKIRLQRGAACAALIDQYNSWPNLEHDDVFDALSMQLGVARPCQFSSLREAEVSYGMDLDDDPEDEWAAYGVGSGAPRRTAGNVGACTQTLPG